MRLLLTLALLLSPPAQATLDVVPAERVAVVPEVLLELARGLQARGVRVVLVPQTGRLFIPGGLADARGMGLALRLPLDRRALAELRTWAGDGACRVVAHAETGLTAADLTLLETIGPCVVELHVARLTPVVAQAEKRLRRGSVVLASGNGLPSDAELRALARLPRPVLSLDAERALEAHAALMRLGASHVVLAVRTSRGLLPTALVQLARDPERLVELRVVASGGLDGAAARTLRALPRTALELSFEGLRAVPEGHETAVNTLLRTIDGPFERPLTDAELDAPLLRF